MAVGARFFAGQPWTHEVNTKYAIDVAASQFTVQVFSGGLLSAFGHSPVIAIQGFSGETEVDKEELQHSRLRFVVPTASLAVKDDISDKDRSQMERIMKQEILETSVYPEIVYECSNMTATKSGEGQYSVALNGDLSMHGVTRSQTVAARVMLNGDSLRAFGTFSLLQTDYELKLASVAGGTLKVKDELKFSFNIVARKKE